MNLRGRKFVFFVAALIATSVIAAFQSVAAERDPKQVLSNVISQLQTGKLKREWYGDNTWKTLQGATDRNGVVRGLAGLGRIFHIDVTNKVDLAAGTVYAMTVQHQRGRSTWHLGINTRIDRIAYLASAWGGRRLGPLPAQPVLKPTADDPPAAPPNPPSPDPEVPSPNPKAPDPSLRGPDEASPACRKFPNLC
jgi:hypothetical protein